MRKEGKLKQLEKEVNKLKKQPEVKVYDGNFLFADIPQAGTNGSKTINVVSGILQGLDTFNRLGNKITLKSLEMRGHAYKTLDVPATARLLLHKSKEQATTVNETATSVFRLSGTSGSALTYDESDNAYAQARNATINHRNHTTMLEKTIQIPQSQISASINAVPFRYFYNFKNAPYVYSNDTLYGKTSTMYLTAINNSNSTSQNVSVEGAYTIKYTDE